MLWLVHWAHTRHSCLPCYSSFSQKLDSCVRFSQQLNDICILRKQMDEARHVRHDNFSCNRHIDPSWRTNFSKPTLRHSVCLGHPLPLPSSPPFLPTPGSRLRPTMSTTTNCTNWMNWSIYILFDYSNCSQLKCNEWKTIHANQCSLFVPKFVYARVARTQFSLRLCR